MGIGSVGSTYLNFVFGTGQETVAKGIKQAMHVRKRMGMNAFQAIGAGAKKGILKSHAEQKAAGGFLKSLVKGFKAIPDGWKAGTTFGGKLKGAFKGAGKALPALMVAMWIIPEIPNVIKATKEKGIGQGLKEVGKFMARITGGAVLGAIGAALIPGVGGILGLMAGEALMSKVVGKSYSEKVAAKTAENATNNTEQAQPATQNTNISRQNGNQRTYIPSETPFGPTAPYVNPLSSGSYIPIYNAYNSFQTVA